MHCHPRKSSTAISEPQLHKTDLQYRILERFTIAVVSEWLASCGLWLSRMLLQMGEPVPKIAFSKCLLAAKWQNAKFH